MTASPTLDALARREVVALRRNTEFDVLFGGGAQEERLVLSGFHGTRSRVLNGLVVDAHRGVGGKALAEARPVTVVDYPTSTAITHDFDAEMATEGIVSLTAVPVLVRGRVRGALYGGLRRRVRPSDSSLDAMTRAADRVSRSLEIEEEVAVRRSSTPTTDLRTTEALTASLLQLRQIVEANPDNELVPALRDLEARLAAPLTCEPPPDSPHLTPRERELVTHLSLGLRNAEIAERLHLSPQTVKTYVRDLMAKLGARSRHEAVVVARAHGLLA